MKYSWSYKNIVRDINKLKRIAQEEKDIKKKCYYLKVIDYLNATIDESTLSNILSAKLSFLSNSIIVEYIFELTQARELNAYLEEYQKNR